MDSSGIYRHDEADHFKDLTCSGTSRLHIRERSAMDEAADSSEHDKTGRLECLWQRAQLPNEIRDFVLDDQKLLNEIC